MSFSLSGNDCRLVWVVNDGKAEIVALGKRGGFDSKIMKRFGLGVGSGAR